MSRSLRRGSACRVRLLGGMVGLTLAVTFSSGALADPGSDRVDAAASGYVDQSVANTAARGAVTSRVSVAST